MADAEPVAAEYDSVDEETYALPEKASAEDILMHPYRSFEHFMMRMTSNFGWKFCVQIAVMYMLVKGLMSATLNLLRLSYCKKTLGVDGTACQTLQVIASTPWAIKGVIGVISDAYPLAGYHKASYILVTACIGTVALFLLATLDINSVSQAAGLMFFVNLEIATCDLLCEGKYAEYMQEKPKTGSAMVSYVWGCFQFGSLIAACFVGPVADHFNPQIIFWVLLPISFSVVIPTALGFLGDKKVPDDKAGLDWSLLESYPYIVSFAVIMAIVALGNAVIDFIWMEEHMVQAIYALSGTVVLSVLAFAWLPRQLAMCNFYMFMCSVLYINVGGAMDFWFTGEEDCVPGGPAFDYTYYNTYTAVVGSFTGWIGIVLFQSTMSGWPFRRLFWVTTLMQVVASGFDLLIINRFNIAWGIPDRWFYMFGDAVIGPAIMMFAFMPAIVLTSKLVPKGLESTTYALLAGFQNFGGQVSSQIGIYATQASGISTTVPCNFDNLSTLVVVSHCLLPLLAIPLTFVLIPDKLMTEKIINDDVHDEPTIFGSVMRGEKKGEKKPDAKAS